MSPVTQQPDRPPDLRVIIDDGRILAVPWRCNLAGADLHARVMDRSELLEPSGVYRLGGVGEKRSVYEAWQKGRDLFCREIRVESSVDRTSQLRDWAVQEGLELTLGEPLPDLGPEPEPLKIPYRSAPQPPDFRFIYVPEDRKLRVTPWGFTTTGLEKLHEPWDGAVGDVIASDRERAVACFGRVEPGIRREAEEALRAWAVADDWELLIEPGVLPLIQVEERPDEGPAAAARSKVPYSGLAVCRDCGDVRSNGSASHMAFHMKGYQRTRCRICGGRYVWSEALVHIPPR